MVEPEVAFADLEDIAKLAENMLKYVFKAVLEERRDDMEFFAQRIEKTAISRLEEFVEKDFAQVDYTDAVEILKACGKKFEYAVEWGVDLQSEHERYLASAIHNSSLLAAVYGNYCFLFFFYPVKNRHFTSYARLNNSQKPVLTISQVTILIHGYTLVC